MAQPNMQNLIQGVQNVITGLGAIAQEAPLILNPPAFAGVQNIIQQLATIQAQLNQLTAMVTANQATATANHTQVTNTLQDINNYIQMTSMQIMNTNAGFTGVLQGPLGPLPSPLNTHDAIDHAVATQLNALNTLKGVPNYAGLVLAKCRAIANFPGIKLYWGGVGVNDYI
ncbi:hypothetical protein Moror_15858 [Moniliophthora roreri MCA 2997]|uniref:Uncharacterized protein n=1 Tax=Moniliophthora roreri (strain MCA 2997) TaxID=1381753 RepID=V2W4G6_MONRO|nr:hypothetical protein Moror_15858 [Moniliophthora roreri MCA 2997]